MNSQIRYLAIVSEQPETLANFYSTYFKMRELGRSDDGDVAVTDGFYNISILKQRSESEETGISHFGITIDDIGAVEARIKEFAPNTDIRKEAGGLFHGDYRVTDPSGQSVTLSTHQFHTPSSNAHSRASAISPCVCQTTTTCWIFMSTSSAFASRRPADGFDRKTELCAGPLTVQRRWPSCRTEPAAT